MTKASSPQSPLGAANLRQVDRAADELRRGQPVVLKGDRALLVLPLEYLDRDWQSWLTEIRSLTGDRATVLISSERAQHLKIAAKGRKAICLSWPQDFPLATVRAIGDPTLDMENPIMGPFAVENRPDSTEEQAAIKLLKVASLLPAAVTVLSGKALTDYAEKEGLMVLDAASLEDYDAQKSAELRLVARARVPLEGAENSHVISFRPASGGPEHLAIVIGDLLADQPVLARLHSECFTGDLLGSLKCDCGTQLKAAIAAIEEAGGGVLLYLAQEGRGVGLTSKLKAYALQDQGFDTVDANVRLGFGVDERFFAPAAEMLKHLKIGTVRLMTNNPQKVEALESFGIRVAERVPHHFPTNHHNEDYLRTKKTRTGHLL